MAKEYKDLVVGLDIGTSKVMAVVAEVMPDGVTFNPANLLPREMDFYHYDGSLTTPPCTEKVKFYILKTQTNISKEQISDFPFKMNARPIQPANGRPIYSN